MIGTTFSAMHAIIQMAQHEHKEPVELEGSYSLEELNELVATMVHAVAALELEGRLGAVLVGLGGRAYVLAVDL
jgi:hypothetical protein